MDWLDLLEVEGNPKSLLKHHSSKASILQCSAFFMVQLLHPYMTTGKTIALTRLTFVGKVMSLPFNMFNMLSKLPFFSSYYLCSFYSKDFKYEGRKAAEVFGLYLFWHHRHWFPEVNGQHKGCMFMFSISFWFSLGRLYISRNLFIYLGFQFCWCIINNHLLWAFVFLWCLL